MDMSAARQFTTLLLLTGLVAGCALADNIHFKNGTVITANQVREKGDQVEYVLGNTTYTVPRWTVERIERTSSFGVTVSQPAPGAAYRDPSFAAGDIAPTPGGRAKLFGRPPSTGPIGTADPSDLRARILNLGRLDSHALAAIEAEGNRDKTAAAYVEAAKFELENNDYDAARTYMRRAVQFAPNQADAIALYVFLLMQGVYYREAVTNAEHAAKIAPNDVDVMRLLGIAYYNSGKIAEAVHAWEHAQQIQPDDRVQLLLEKAQREAKVEENFAELQSPHFTIRFEGRQPGFTLRTDLLRTLERHYGDLARDLGYAPPANITVILYTEKQFFDVTQAPAWAGALNDGKLRIPVADVSGMTPKLESVLKHELTHSFIHFMTMGHCPRWLNEGIAMMMEPRSSAEFREGLAYLFAKKKNAPLAALEGSFMRYSGEQATIAYVESLAATEYLRDNWHMTGIQRILQLIGDGQTGEAALRAVTRQDYAEFEKALGEYLIANSSQGQQAAKAAQR
jgi:tetratricopeptide (TPR) repeat protein